MPRAARLSKRKFKTDKVQGPGSHIIFSKPTFQESKQFVDALREVTADIGDPSKASEIENEMTDLIFTKAQELFSEWNWGDEDGEPLTDLDEIDIDDIGVLLLAEEVETIIECIRMLFGIIEDKEKRGKSRV